MKLLITPLALQSIQLRSVKRPERDNSAESDRVEPQEPELDLLQDPEAQPWEPPTAFPLSNSPPGERSCRWSASSGLKDVSICGSATDESPNGDPEDHLSNGGEPVDRHSSFSSPPRSCQSSPVKQKPPAVSKKPQLSFIPPFSARPLNGAPDRDATNPAPAEDRPDAAHLQTAEEEEDDQSEPQQSWESGGAPAAGPVEPAPASRDPHLSNGPCVNGETPEEEAEEDGSSSLAGSLSSREDDNGESHPI